MNDEMVISVVRDAFYYVIIVCGPLLLTSLIIGLLISIFQAATSISEQTLTFVPKLIAVFIVSIIILPFMISSMKKLILDMMNIIQTLK